MDIRLALTWLSALLLIHCGMIPEPFQAKRTKSAETMPSAPAALTPISVSLLLDAPNWTIDITGCSSGYFATGLTSSPISLYANDRGCQAVLRSFDFNGKHWTHPQGCCATANDVEFTAAGTSQTLFVKATQRLPDPIAAGGGAQFVFKEILVGNDAQLILQGATGNHQSLDPASLVHNDPPNVRIKVSSGFRLFDINSTTRIATFRINLECLLELVGGDSQCTSATQAQNQTLSNLRIALVNDLWNHTPTWSEARDAVENASEGDNRRTVDGSNLQARAVGYNGGIQVDLKSPGESIGNKNYLLLAEYYDAATTYRSYTYFNVDFVAGPLLFESLPFWLQRNSTYVEGWNY